MRGTFAMKVYATTYWVLVADFVYVLVALILPNLGNPDVAAFLPVIAAFLGIFLVVALAATAWPGARRRRWFWLVGLVPPILFLLMNAPFIPYAITHPADTPGFVAVFPMVIATVVLVLAGWRAAQDARSATPAPGPTLRTSLALTAVVAATVAALATSFLAGGGGGAVLAAAPTTTATLVAHDVTFAPTTYEIASDDVLGLFIENRDAFAHSFDIDALNIHVQLPANATVAVAIKPNGPGSIQFYCAIPGHTEAGMAGTISVR